MNSGIELPRTISALAKCYLSIYEQMQVTDWIKEKAKFSTKVQIAANIPLRAVTNSSRAHTISNNNTFFSHLSNIFWGTITFISRNLDVETLRPIKEERYFNYKERGQIIHNCPEKTKISTITDASVIDDTENIDQEKE